MPELRAERRGFMRRKATVEVHYWLPGCSPAEGRQALLEDISEGGVRLAAQERLTIGQEILLALDKHQHPPGLSGLSGIVAWQEDAVDYSRDNAIETGVSFSPSDLDTKDTLRKWLLRDEVIQSETAETSEVIDVGSAYDSSTITFQVLRAFGWGPLINLGYFRFPSPISALNVLYNLVLLKTGHMLPQAQIRLVRKSFEFLDIRTGDRVLDIACGRGLGSFLLACSYPTSDVIGVDLLPEHIKVASALYGNVRNLRFEHGDALNLRFKDNSFDKVLCLEAAFHFAGREKFLEEAFRILTDDGRLVVVDFAWKTDESRRILEDELALFVRHEWKWVDFFSIDQYLRSAQSAGFEVKGFHKWSRRVTGPIQFVFSTLAEAGRWSWSRAALFRLNPLLRSLTDDDWVTLRYSARAHNYVRRHVEYVVLVLGKSGGAWKP